MNHKTLSIEVKDHPLVEGKIELRVPFYQERLRLLKELDYKITDDGKLESSSESALERMAKSVEIVERYIVKVCLKVKESGLELTSIEDLMTYEDLQDLVSQLSLTIIRGMRLGKS